MKVQILSYLTAFLCLSSAFLFAEDTIQDKATGVTFPKEVAFQYDAKDYKLQATGVATRKKFFVKIYSIASYIEEGANTNGPDKLQAFLQDDKAKQLTMKWVYDADAQKVQNGYLESFKASLSADQYNQLQNEINTFVQYFNKDIKKGDEHILRWFPGGTVVVLINGSKVGTIKNVEFAKALWSIWFGPKSVVDRNNLVSLVK